MTAAFLTERENKRTEATDDIELMSVESKNAFWNFVRCNKIIIGKSSFKNCVFRFEGCTDLTIFGNSFDGCELSNFIQFAPTLISSNVTIINNRFIGPKLPSHKVYGVRVENGATGDALSIRNVDNFTIVGNYFYGGGELGIAITHGCTHGLIANNTIEATDCGGIWVGDDGGIVYDIAIVKNVITECALNAAGDAANQAGISVRYGRNISLIRNSIGGNAPDMQFGIAARDIDGLTISGNSIDGVKKPFRVPRNGNVSGLLSDLKATV